jgi:hypothetical protein
VGSRLTTATAATVRPVRAVAAAVVLALLWAPAAAYAAGTGGIEVTPVPGVVDGRQVTSFRAELPGNGTTSVTYALRNITDEPRSARIYAAAARPDGQGSFTIGDAGSSPYVSLDDRRVELEPGEVRAEEFEVESPGDDRPNEVQYAAVVVEVEQGAVIQRAATLVYLEPGSATSLPLPLPLVVAAIVLIVAVGVAVAVAARRRRDIVT